MQDMTCIQNFCRALQLLALIVPRLNTAIWKIFWFFPLPFFSSPSPYPQNGLDGKLSWLDFLSNWELNLHSSYFYVSLM